MSEIKDRKPEDWQDEKGWIHAENESVPFDDEPKEESREWWNDEEKAREAAAQFGMTPEEMAAAGMHPDGTPYESGPADEDPTLDEAAFADAVGNLGTEAPEQGR